MRMRDEYNSWTMRMRLDEDLDVEGRNSLICVHRTPKDPRTKAEWITWRWEQRFASNVVRERRVDSAQMQGLDVARRERTELLLSTHQ